jgi:hypothetical protein
MLSFAVNVFIAVLTLIGTIAVVWQLVLMRTHHKEDDA